jgi:hypothetical protein
MLFESFGMKITSDCILLDQHELDDIKTVRFCAEQETSLVFYVDGELYNSDIFQYVLENNDRILIFLGDTKSISKHFTYLESLKIPNIPKKTPQYSENNITV